MRNAITKNINKQTTIKQKYTNKLLFLELEPQDAGVSHGISLCSRWGLFYSCTKSLLKTIKWNESIKSFNIFDTRTQSKAKPKRTICRVFVLSIRHSSSLSLSLSPSLYVPVSLLSLLFLYVFLKNNLSCGRCTKASRNWMKYLKAGKKTHRNEKKATTKCERQKK